MKKNWFGLIFWSTFFILAAWNFVACNNGGNNSSSPAAAAYNPYATPGNNAYGYGAGYGQSWYVPPQWMYAQYNCGCMTGYVAVTNPTYGQACAPQATGTYSYVVTYNINWAGGPAQNTYPLSTPQFQFNSAGANNCYGAMAQGCDTRNNTCPGGSICQPVGGGNAFGICVH